MLCFFFFYISCKYFHVFLFGHVRHSFIDDIVFQKGVKSWRYFRVFLVSFCFVYCFFAFFGEVLIRKALEVANTTLRKRFERNFLLKHLIHMSKWEYFGVRGLEKPIPCRKQIIIHLRILSSFFYGYGYNFATQLHKSFSRTFEIKDQICDGCSIPRICI